MSILVKLVKGFRMKLLNLYVHPLQILIKLTLDLSLWRNLSPILSGSLRNCSVVKPHDLMVY